MAFQVKMHRFFAVLLGTLLFVAGASPGAHAQVRRSAADQGAPPQSMAELAQRIPGNSTFAGAVDTDVMVQAFSDVWRTFGFSSEEAVRELVSEMIADEFPDDFPVVPVQVHAFAFGGTSEDRSVAMVLDATAARSDADLPTDPTFRSGATFALRDRSIVVGEGVSFDRAAADEGHFDLTEVWPRAAEAIGDAPLGWFYLSDPELMEDLNREFEGWLRRATVSRVAFGFRQDGGFVGVFDVAQPGAFSAAAGRARVSGPAVVAAELPSPEVGRYLGALIEAAWAHLEITDDGDTAVIRMNAPTCGGATQQLIGGVLAFMSYVRAEERGLATDAAWPAGPVATSTPCPSSANTPASLPWTATSALPDAPRMVAVLVDGARFFDAFAPSAGGLAPYPLDDETLREVFAGTPAEMLIDGPAPIGAATWGPALDEELSFMPLPLAEALGETASGREVAGLGWTEGAVADDYDPVAELDPMWARFQRAVPAASPAAIMVSAAIAHEAVAEAPPMARGATTLAIGASDGIVFAGDQGQLVVRLLGVEADQAEPVQNHLRAAMRDAASMAGAFGAPSFLPNHLAGWVDHVVVSPFDDGLEIRLQTEGQPTMAALFGLGGIVAFSRGMIPTATPPSGPTTQPTTTPVAP